jgi:hypothetical protein
MIAEACAFLGVLLQLVAFWTGMLCVAGAGLPTRLNYNASATQLQSVLANLAATHNYINTEFPPRTDAQVSGFCPDFCACHAVFHGLCLGCMVGQVDFRFALPDVSPARGHSGDSKPNLHRHDGQLRFLWWVSLVQHLFLVSLWPIS